MDNLNIIIGFTVGGLSLLTLIFPNLSLKNKIVIIFFLILFGVAGVYYRSDNFNHWRYFEANKVNIRCHQLTPIIVDDNNFYYKYIAVILNKYTEKIKITNCEMDFQSRLFLNGSDILLSDIPEKLIRIKINDSSILSAKIERLSRGQIIAISIDASLQRRKFSTENYDATINFSYKLFGRHHKKSFYVKPMEVISSRMPKKESIIFDVVKVLDHRRLPNKFFTYYYFKEASESGDRKLEVYLSDEKDRFLKIKSEQPNGVKILESERPIHKDIDPARILVSSNNDILIQSWIGNFRREKAARNFRLGLELVKKKDFKAGATAFKKTTEIDPKDFKAWFNMGLALEQAKDYKAAIDSFQKAIKVKGDYFKAYGELGNVFIKIGDTKKAVYFLKHAIEINNKYAFALFKLGCLQKSQGNYKEALSNLADAIKYEPNAEMREKYKECLKDIQKNLNN